MDEAVLLQQVVAGIEGTLQPNNDIRKQGKLAAVCRMSFLYEPRLQPSCTFRRSSKSSQAWLSSTSRSRRRTPTPRCSSWLRSASRTLSSGYAAISCGLLALIPLPPKTWSVREDERDFIGEQYRGVIKTFIVDVMLLSPDNIRAVLSVAITTIAESDFPKKWEALLPVPCLLLFCARIDPPSPSHRTSSARST